MVALFLQKGLLNPDFARKLLGWKHSGFSNESGTRIQDQPTREALCQYIVRAPHSLQRRYSSLEFIAQATLHVPPRSRHLRRRYGLYSSRGRGTGKHHLALRSRAPASWYGRNASAAPALPDAPKDREVDALSRRRSWARLLAKVHELDVMACPRCGSRMSLIIIIITDPAQIRKIIDYLERHGRGPPPRGGRDRHITHLLERDSHGGSMSTPARSGFVRMQMEPPRYGDDAFDRGSSSASMDSKP